MPNHPTRLESNTARVYAVLVNPTECGEFFRYTVMENDKIIDTTCNQDTAISVVVWHMKQDIQRQTEARVVGEL